MDRRKFLTYVGCGCCGFALNSCTTAPITERRQLKIVSEAKLNAQAAAIYEKVKEKEKMSDDIKSLNEIREIGKKMEYSIGEYFYRSKLNDPTVNFDWEYILIDNKKVRNAWCMPGGKIAIYSGMLEVTKNKNGLAAVMGHEINRTTGMNTVGLLSQLGIMFPFNRKQESEADYLGLIFSSLSGYDIRETTKIWERMKEFNKGKTPSEFMSTHPSPDNRIRKIKDWTNSVTLDYPPIKDI
jgi:predicted Zn-dependent protease